MFSLDWVSGVVLFVALIPLYFLARWFQKRSQSLFRLTRVTSARVIVHFVETMTGIRAVKAFRKEKRNETEFGRPGRGLPGGERHAPSSCSASSIPGSS